ncbi:MAG TPA: DUF3303 family protein [Gemmatimonadales bacterium]|nr:DUF3303 family protein [Gemmatimonadales bacterium]
MLYVVVEDYRSGDPVAVYRRLRDRGRMMPEGLEYLGSWVTTDLRRCYQVMACDDRKRLEDWAAAWSDLVDFEIVPVITSAEARAAVEPRL